MSRVIKFRGWDNKNKRMENIDGYDIYIADGKVFEVREANFAYTTYTYKKDVSDRYILMQFTGLKDKNGKEIYEGDIVYCAIQEADRTGFILDYTATVEYDICNPCFVLKQENGRVEYDFVMCGLMILEVIGNIYQKELMNVENKSNSQRHTHQGSSKT